MRNPNASHCIDPSDPDAASSLAATKTALQAPQHNNKNSEWGGVVWAGRWCDFCERAGCWEKRRQIQTGDYNRVGERSNNKKTHPFQNDVQRSELHM